MKPEQVSHIVVRGGGGGRQADRKKCVKFITVKMQLCHAAAVESADSIFKPNNFNYLLGIIFSVL